MLNGKQISQHDNDRDGSNRILILYVQELQYLTRAELFTARKYLKWQ
jgi:hypothetical protein